MMELDFRPTHFECRIYSDGDSFAQRSPYVGCFNVSIQENTAYVTMLHGAWDREVHQKLADKLLALGIEDVCYEHNSRYKRVSPMLSFG